MKSSTLLVAALALTGAALPWTASVAQEPDTAPRRPARAIITQPGVLTIDTLTLVVVTPSGAGDTLGVWTTGSAVASQARLRPAHLPPRGQLVDRRHAALSMLPPGVGIGYVLAAPGLAPTLVRGAVPRAALEDSVRAFLRRYWAVHR